MSWIEYCREEEMRWKKTAIYVALYFAVMKDMTYHLCHVRPSPFFTISGRMLCSQGRRRVLAVSVKHYWWTLLHVKASLHMFFFESAGNLHQHGREQPGRSSLPYKGYASDITTLTIWFIIVLANGRELKVDMLLFEGFHDLLAFEFLGNPWFRGTRKLELATN